MLRWLLNISLYLLLPFFWNWLNVLIYWLLIYWLFLFCLSTIDILNTCCLISHIESSFCQPFDEKSYKQTIRRTIEIFGSHFLLKRNFFFSNVNFIKAIDVRLGLMYAPFFTLKSMLLNCNLCYWTNWI